MIIHVVQPGDTIYSIAEHYNIPVDRLILENGLTNLDNLVIGQTIIIVQPETLYTVQEGDTLESIAEQHGTTPMELLRNNPYLSNRESLYAGESIVINYQTNKTKIIATSGYIFPHIDKSVLIKALPFLTYLIIFNYMLTNEGEIISTADDTEIIKLAKIYGTAPMMFVSAISQEDINNPVLQDLLINNALQILKNKGYYGINIYFMNINNDNINNIADYLKKASAVFHEEGFRVFLTTTPFTNIEGPNISFEKIDYSKLAESVDGIMFSSNDWARSYSYPNATYPIYVLRELLDYVVSIIPSEKIHMGISALGYDWTLPYFPGISGGTAITNEDAIQIAAKNEIPIQFNEAAKSPYFYYTDSKGILNVVWFKDARSFDTRAELADEYDLGGLSIWTIIRFDNQLWLIINSLYYIQKI